MSKYKVLSIKVTPVDYEQELFEERNKTTYEQQFELESAFGACSKSNKSNPKHSDIRTIEERPKRHRKLSKADDQKRCRKSHFDICLPERSL